MDHFLLGLIGAFFGVLMGTYVRLLIETRKYPYRYECHEPGCFCRFRSNDLSTLDLLASDHERHFHGTPSD